MWVRMWLFVKSSLFSINSGKSRSIFNLPFKIAQKRYYVAPLRLLGTTNPNYSKSKSNKNWAWHQVLRWYTQMACGLRCQDLHVAFLRAISPLSVLAPSSCALPSCVRLARLSPLKLVELVDCSRSAVCTYYIPESRTINPPNSAPVPHMRVYA